MSFFKLLNPDLPHHIVRVPGSLDYSFNEPKLFKALKRIGATAAESEALLELLHDIGWGGIEFPAFGASFKDFTQPELRKILAWYRTAYFNTKTTQNIGVKNRKSQIDQFVEDQRELQVKKLFNYAGKEVHFKSVHSMKGKKLE